MAGTAGGIVEYFSPGDRVTCTSSGSTTGGNLVKLVGNRIVSPTASGDRASGVALYNAADTEKVTVAYEGVWPLKAATTITAGQLVVATGSGQVTPITGTATAGDLLVGEALEGINSGASGPVRLKL
jgi:hypothetical protein